MKFSLGGENKGGFEGGPVGTSEIETKTVFFFLKLNITFLLMAGAQFSKQQRNKKIKKSKFFQIEKLTM